MEQKKPLTRFGEFELLKALAILGLPLVHMMEETIESNIATNDLAAFGNIIIVLCAFGPSIFMICMGFGIGGGKQIARNLKNSGIQFLFIGALLNIVRWLIPGIIQKLVLETNLIDDIDFCLQSDIYYFVGFFFLFYALLKKLNLSTPQVALISLITLTLNTMLTPIMQKYITNPVVSSIVGNIIYVDETSCFPLFSWTIFPVVGIILGEILKKRDDEFREIFMRRLMDFSFVIFVSFGFFLWNYKINVIKVIVSPGNDYITDFPNVIMLISLAGILLGIFYYLCKIIGSSKFMAFMLKQATYIMPFYLLQWIIIAWFIYGLDIAKAPRHSIGLPVYFITSLGITVFCMFVSMKYGMKIMKMLLKMTRVKKKRKKKSK